MLRADGPLWFKLEYTQHAGSFKTRGMLNQILAAAERGALPEAGIVAASGGNAGPRRGLGGPRTGRAGRGLRPGGRPAGQGRQAGQARRPGGPGRQRVRRGVAAAAVRAAATGALFCHAYDDAAMVAGNGTLGLELLEQIPDGFDTVLVAVGGGGLIAGVVAALHEHARVVAVEPTTSAALHEALRSGGPVDVPVSGVAADSLGARRAGEIAVRAVAARPA